MISCSHHSVDGTSTKTNIVATVIDRIRSFYPTTGHLVDDQDAYDQRSVAAIPYLSILISPSNTKISNYI